MAAAAEQDYCAEAKVYIATVGSELQGSVMPTFHGSWTFKVGTVVAGREYTREVRMILVEHIVGTSMLDIDTFDLTDEQKINIFYKALEAETDLRIAGIKHHDFEPRNIMVASSVELPEGLSYDPASFECSDLRVCIIDFAMASVRKKPLKKKRRNPLFRWAGYQPWVLDDWFKYKKDVDDWLWEKWGNGGKAQKYIPAIRNMEDTSSRPLKRRKLH